MMTSLKSLLGYRLQAQDGPLGNVYDFHFDNGTWRIRHMAAELHAHVPWPKVLIDREQLGAADWVNRSVVVRLGREEIRHAPRISRDPPLYRRLEEQKAGFYMWAAHWTPYSGMPEPEWKEGPIGHVELRSLRHLLGGYRVVSHEGELLGCPTDFLADDDDWRIQLMVIEREGVKEQVALPVDIITHVLYPAHRMEVNVDADQLFDAPRHDTLQLRNPHYCGEVRAHFQQKNHSMQPA